MPDTPKQIRAYRFGLFEVDLRAQELHKSGLKVRIQEQFSGWQADRFHLGPVGPPTNLEMRQQRIKSSSID